MSMLSKFLSYDAATRSATATAYRISNVPDQTQICNLRGFGTNIYDPVCDRFGVVYTSSVFRCPALNVKVGGSRTSGHVKGECGDLDGDAPNDRYAKVDNVELFNWIRTNLQFDQLIAEFELNGSPKWCHVGYREGANRGQVLIATKNSSGRTVYLAYTESLFNKIYRKSRNKSFVMPDTFEMPEIDFQTGEDEEVTGNFDFEVSENKALDISRLKIVDPIPLEVPLPGLIQLAPPTVITVGNTRITVTVENLNPEPDNGT